MRKKVINPCYIFWGIFFNRFLDEYTTIKVNPGPAKYNFQPALNKNGKYYNTKYHNSLAKRWNPMESVRFSNILSEGKKKEAHGRK